MVKAKPIRRGGKWIGDIFYFELSAAAPLALEFVNTLDARKGRAIELIPDYGALLSWSRQAAALSDVLVDQLACAAAQSPQIAAQVHAEAVSLREALFRVFDAACAATRPEDMDMATVNHWIARAATKRVLYPARPAYVARFAEDPADLRAMLWPVAQSAFTVLSDSDMLRRLRFCEGANCAWAFIDFSRRQNRRWCDMSVCGNRAKARRRRARETSPSGLDKKKSKGSVRRQARPSPHVQIGSRQRDPE